MTLQFQNLQEKILAAIHNHQNERPIEDPDSQFYLMPGFSYICFKNDFPAFVPPHPDAVAPCVTLVSTKTARVYTFSVLQIMPELKEYLVIPSENSAVPDDLVGENITDESKKND